MPILNDAELNDMLIKDFKEIVDEVVDEVYLKLRESIEKEVYGAGTPSPDGYQRNKDDGGLLGSFLKENTRVSGQEIEGEIFHDPMTMVNDPDDFVHGSNHWEEGDDVREILADMIIAGMDDTKSPRVGTWFGFGFWSLPRDFWTPVMELFESGKVDKMVEASMSAHGIIWRRI